MDPTLLEDIGFTKGEIKVYLALLKLGESTTGLIIEHAKISSGKVYVILGKLIDKGLASFIIKEKTKYFTAASPNRIIDYLHNKEQSLKEKEQKILQLLPSLLAIRNSTKKNYETNLFRGIKGIEAAIYESLEELTTNDEDLTMGVISSKKKQYNIMFQRWHKARIKRKILCKVLFSDRDTEYFEAFKKMKYTEVRVLEGITPSAVDVMNDTIHIYTYGEVPSCLAIRNPEIALSFRSFFYNLWSLAKKE
ncbi:MAG: helix-turn-helix domain-containing protein [Nanoarchaeota archaeon]